MVHLFRVAVLTGGTCSRAPHRPSFRLDQRCPVQDGGRDDAKLAPAPAGERDRGSSEPAHVPPISPCRSADSPPACSRFKLSLVREPAGAGPAAASLAELQAYLAQYPPSYYTKNGKEPLVYPYVLALSLQVTHRPAPGHAATRMRCRDSSVSPLRERSGETGQDQGAHSIGAPDDCSPRLPSCACKTSSAGACCLLLALTRLPLSCSCRRRCCTSPRTPPRRPTAPTRCTWPSCWAPRSARGDTRVPRCPAALASQSTDSWPSGLRSLGTSSSVRRAAFCRLILWRRFVPRARWLRCLVPRPAPAVLPTPWRRWRR